MAITITQCISTILRVMFQVLPKHAKRLVFWSALYGKMCGATGCTRVEALSMGMRLNSVMSIAKDCSACVLPIVVGKYIYKDLENCANAAKSAMCDVRCLVKEGIDTEKGIDTNFTSLEAGNRFINSIPNWMRYASPEYMRNDFQRLLLSHTAAA